jgi:hypothetical protein
MGGRGTSEHEKDGVRRMDDTTMRGTADPAGSPSGDRGAGPAPEARDCGFPAVLGHEVVAVSAVARDDWASSEQGHLSLVRWQDGAIDSKRLPADRLYVWARAGRITFAGKDGEMVNMTLLGEREYEGLQLGAPWPRAHTRSKASNLAHGAVEDVKNVVTFPASFPRMMRTSGERNAMLSALVGWCEREIPDIHVLRGWPHGAEGPDEHQVPALPHKGLMGQHGWLEGTVGVEAEAAGDGTGTGTGSGSGSGSGNGER